MDSTYILVLIALGSVICFYDEVKAECGGLIEATSGVISSPSYPSKYPPNHRCIWEIKMPANSRIGIRFRDFRMQGCYNDYVTIRSRSGNGNILQHLDICTRPNDTILTESNNVLIEFLSDSSIEYEGFELEFFKIFSQCGGLIEEGTGALTTPQHPSKYPNNANCEWTIQAPLNHTIQLNFEKFHTENCMDYVTVKSRMVDGAVREHGKFCGTSIPPVVISKSNVLLIQFKSDGSVEYSGFLAVFSTVFSNCGGLIEKSSGTIAFPRDLQFSSKVNCTWTIQAPLNQSVKLDFEKLPIAESGGCFRNYVTVKNKYPNGDIRNEGRFCGSPIPSFIISESNIFLVQFVSDGTRQYSEFLASFSIVISKCGGLIETNSGTIITPRDVRYSKEANCTWTIQAPLNHSIKLDFEKLRIAENDGCHREFLSVKSKMADGDIREHGKFCGTTAPPAVISESNVLLVQIMSYYATQYKEFEVVFSSEMCGGLIDGGRGNISTPFFPLSYPPNKMCEWSINVPSQHKLKLRFLHFDIEDGGKDCSNDFVLIQTKTADGEIYRYGKYCGNSRPPSIYTRDSILLKFVSDRNVQKEGFKVEYIIDKLTDYELSTSMRKSTHHKSLTKKYDHNQMESFNLRDANKLPDS